MDIFLNDITLERINFFDENKIQYIQLLSEQESISKYLPALKDGIPITKNIGYFSSHYVVKKNGNMIGYCYLSHPFNRKNKNVTEIRYAIDENNQGNGIGKDLVNQTSDFIINNTDIDGIMAVIDKDNQISKHIIESSNFHKTDVNEIEGEEYTRFRI